MKHQILIVFAAPLKARDGEGTRLCMFLKEISADQAPARGAKLTVAGFAFVHDRKLSQGQQVAYLYEPVTPVSYEWFTLKAGDGPWRRELKSGRRDREHIGEAAAGVLISRGNSKIMTLINRLKADGYAVVIGSRSDGGFNPYDRPTR